MTGQGRGLPLFKPGRAKLPDEQKRIHRRQIFLSAQDRKTEETLLRKVRDVVGAELDSRELWFRGLSLIAGRKNKPLTINLGSSRLPNKECPERR